MALMGKNGKASVRVTLRHCRLIVESRFDTDERMEVGIRRPTAVMLWMSHEKEFATICCVYGGEFFLYFGFVALKQIFVGNAVEKFTALCTECAKEGKVYDKDVDIVCILEYYKIIADCNCRRTEK